jgi:putative addiction module component (TIGR02574 family)
MKAQVGTEALPLYEWQRKLLDQRLADAEANPDAWLTWDEVKARVFASLEEPSRT